MPKQKQRQIKKKKAPDLAPESRPAEVVTVAWMLSMLVTVAAELLGGAVWVALALADSGGVALPVLLIPSLMLFIATVTGFLCLVLTKPVYRLRRVPPPSPITKFGIIVGVLPLVAWLITMVLAWAR